MHGILLLGLPNLLVSTNQLVQLELALDDDDDPEYTPPDAMGSCLAMLPNLNQLVIELNFSTSHPRLTSPLPPVCDILPSLTNFHFTGIGEYLEDLVARINTPLLYHFTMIFYKDFNFVTSQLVQFISCTEWIKELHQTHYPVELDSWSVRMSNRLGGCLELGIRYNRSSWRFDSLEQLCYHLLPLLSQVESLRVCEDPSC